MLYFFKDALQPAVKWSSPCSPMIFEVVQLYKDCGIVEQAAPLKRCGGLDWYLSMWR